jgi:DivIVA domain-containing protein
MTDEQFRLTPLDVRRWEFGSALRGYDRARVDEFKARVADEIEELNRRINDLDSKARGFHEQIRTFRERDRAINDALVSAQQLRNDIREQAEKEGNLTLAESKADAEKVLTEAKQRAEETLREAQDQANKILREATAEGRALVDDSRSAAKKIARDLDELNRSRQSYLSQMKALAERHLQEVAASRATAPNIPSSVDKYLHEADDAVESRIKPRKTPPVNTIVPAKETITDPAAVRALTDGILPSGILGDGKSS